MVTDPKAEAAIAADRNYLRFRDASLALAAGAIDAEALRSAAPAMMQAALAAIRGDRDARDRALGLVGFVLADHGERAWRRQKTDDAERRGGATIAPQGETRP